MPVVWSCLDWAFLGKSFYAAICDIEIAAVAAQKFTLNLEGIMYFETEFQQTV